jgi:hypothetical protein
MSSSYGYVPANKAPLLQEQYGVAVPSTWTFFRQMSGDPADIALFGGVEVDGSFSAAQKAELTALGGAHFDSAHGFNLWRNQFSPA